MTRCLAPDCRMGGVGCDNMTVIIVCLLQGQDYNELSNKCAHLPASVTSGSVRDRGNNDVLDISDENDEWFDCADELLTESAHDNISNSHIETSEVVKPRQMDEEPKQDEVKQMDEETKQDEEGKQDEVRQMDEETQQDEEVRQEEVEEREIDEEEDNIQHMETDTITPALLNSEAQKEDFTSCSVSKEDNNDEYPVLVINGDQSDSLLDKQQLYKSTAV